MYVCVLFWMKAYLTWGLWCYGSAGTLWAHNRGGNRSPTLTRCSSSSRTSESHWNCRIRWCMASNDNEGRTCMSLYGSLDDLADTFVDDIKYVLFLDCWTSKRRIPGQAVWSRESFFESTLKPTACARVPVRRDMQRCISNFIIVILLVEYKRT